MRRWRVANPLVQTIRRRAQRGRGICSLDPDAAIAGKSRRSICFLEDALLDLTNCGDTVVDPFLGSDSTLIAAEKTEPIAGLGVAAGGQSGMLQSGCDALKASLLYQISKSLASHPPDTPRGHSGVGSLRKKIMPRATKIAQGPELTLEERRERRRLRREKQREDNVHRAAKMHAARPKMEATSLNATAEPKSSLYVGCSGWRYWNWRDSFYAEVPQPDWFNHYLKRFDTVEINASFYSWPTVANVQAWRRAPGKKKFVYTVKVCELITHVKKFKGTKTLVKDFGMIADILGDRMGCFLFQLPPSYRYTKVQLNDIVSQLDSARRNVVEFRHASWWNEEVYGAFRKAGIIFCSCSGPRLPDELIRTADEVYVRLHGPKRWYRHDYSKEGLADWATRINDSGAKRAWVYFNNDFDAYAPKNAVGLRRMLRRAQGFR